MKTKSAKKASAHLARSRTKARIKARRPIHKKLLLHPAMLFMLLCIGLLVLGSAIITKADSSYSVHAKVSADPLTESAIILSPKDGAHVTASPAILSGTCPYKSYINVERNNVFAGTTLCNPDGTFSLSVGLLGGNNALQAHVFNITDDEGPLSSAINVIYDIPPPPAPASGTSITKPSQPAKPSPKPFVITGTYNYQGFKNGQEQTWSFEISGGIGPFAINVKWGDGSEANYVQKDDGPIIISHIYKKPGIYTIKINGADSLGGSAYLQTTSIVTDGKNPGIANATSGSSGTNQRPQPQAGWRTAAVYVYGILALMVVSYWLGEKHEYLQLLRTSQRSSRRNR